jgi:hypothetical protein
MDVKKRLDRVVLRKVMKLKLAPLTKFAINALLSFILLILLSTETIGSLAVHE